ncbi:hypothetical protein HN51_041312 [Arachis hypogaea]
MSLAPSPRNDDMNNMKDRMHSSRENGDAATTARLGGARWLGMVSSPRRGSDRQSMKRQRNGMLLLFARSHVSMVEVAAVCNDHWECVNSGRCYGSAVEARRSGTTCG